MDSPIFVAPTGIQGPLHPEAEAAMHRGAAAAHVPVIWSNNTTVPIDKVAAVDQFVDQLVAFVGGCVREELLALGQRWEPARQIDADAAEEGGVVADLRGREA